MKLFYTLGLFLTILVAGKTTAQTFEKGATMLGAGVQFEQFSKPIVLSIEYGIADVLSGGGRIVFAKGSTFAAGVINYHLNRVLNTSSDKLDTFAGISPGISLGGGTSGFMMMIQGGGRYMLAEKIGVYGQLNIGIINNEGSNLELGIAYKLK